MVRMIDYNECKYNGFTNRLQVFFCFCLFFRAFFIVISLKHGF